MAHNPFTAAFPNTKYFVANRANTTGGCQIFAFKLKYKKKICNGCIRRRRKSQMDESFQSVLICPKFLIKIL